MSIEQSGALKAAEEQLARALRRSAALQGRLEDLLYRAQRLANARRRSLPAEDGSLAVDIKSLRGDLRGFGEDLQGLLPLFGRLEGGRAGSLRPLVVLSERLNMGVRTLLEQSRLTHEHMQQAALRPEVWALVQDADLLVARATGVKTAAAKLWGGS